MEISFYCCLSATIFLVLIQIPRLLWFPIFLGPEVDLEPTTHILFCRPPPLLFFLISGWKCVTCYAPLSSTTPGAAQLLSICFSRCFCGFAWLVGWFGSDCFLFVFGFLFIPFPPPPPDRFQAKASACWFCSHALSVPREGQFLSTFPGMGSLSSYSGCWTV